MKMKEQDDGDFFEALFEGMKSMFENEEEDYSDAAQSQDQFYGFLA